jgi:hypothetical protein
MKTINQLKPVSIWGKTLMMLALILSTIQTFAQSVPEKVEVDVNTGGDAVWYGQPWVWVVGVAVFIVIIVAITRNNSSRA